MLSCRMMSAMCKLARGAPQDFGQQAVAEERVKGQQQHGQGTKRTLTRVDRHWACKENWHLFQT
eukprot:2502178-Pyramimonas_sp.AAC.1